MQEDPAFITRKEQINKYKEDLHQMATYKVNFIKEKLINVELNLSD